MLQLWAAMSAQIPISWGGAIRIETDPQVVKTLEDTEGWSVSKLLWPELRKLFNGASTTMKKNLTNNFLVRKFHPLLQEYYRIYSS